MSDDHKRHLLSTRVRGYGELSEAAARELEALTTEISDLLDRMDSCLAGGAGHDLQVRVERRGKTRREVE